MYDFHLNTNEYTFTFTFTFIENNKRKTSILQWIKNMHT